MANISSNKIRKEEQDMKYNNDYKRSYKDKTTGQTVIYYSKYRYDLKEYAQIRQLAFIKMKQYNQKLYNNKDINYKDKKFINHEEALKRILKLPKADVLAALDNYKQQQELKQEAKIKQRMQQLEKAEEAANRYFTAIELKKRHNLEVFINRIKEGTPEEKTKALNWFNSLTPELQEETINKVDNYLHTAEHQDIEISIEYIEDMKGGE